MKNKITKKLLAILMIITILAADFFVLGTNLITYATELNSQTSNSGIEFSAYFKEKTTEGTTIKEPNITKSIKNKDLKLYAEIKVNTEDGYLESGAQIEVADSNFNIVSTNLGRVEGNKIILDNIRIDKANPVEVEIGIEPIIADEIAIDMLTKQSIIRFTSTYIYSGNRDGETVEAEKQVCVSYQPETTAEAELNTQIITNQLLEIINKDGQKEVKRIVQLLVKSRLTENQYPVKQTKLTINHPELTETTPEPEMVTAIALGKLATNGTTDISSVANQNGVVEITINNNTEENKPISWNKNIYDELVVTFIYADSVDTTNIEIETNSNLTLYNGESKTPEEPSIATCSDNGISQVLIGRTEVTTPEIYKGQLYANATGTNHTDIQYNTKSELIITNADIIVDEIVMTEGRDVFEKADETELAVNTKYISTEINVKQVLNLFGTNGNIEIKNGNQTILIDSVDLANADENGNITITYEEPNSELYITTSKLVNVGILELKHTKAIIQSDLTRAQLQTVKTLNTKNSVLGTITVDKQKQNIVQNATEASFNLTETVSKATLTVNKESLSSTTSNDVTLGITLVTDGVQYDLYQNPVIRLEMPAAVEKISKKQVKKVYDDINEFGEPVVDIDEANKVVQITLANGQTSYPAEQLYIQLELNLTLSKFAPTQEDLIIMKYTNGNATQYADGGINFGKVEQEIGISGVGELLTMFNLSSNENTSLTETIMQQVSRENTGANLGFGITVFNDTEADMNNAKILGKLPTTGNTITGENVANTLETILTNINASNATIYYTENVDATTDVSDGTNGWTTDLTAITNAKLYLIDLGTLSKGSVYTADVNVKLPDSIPANAISYTEYEFIYDTGSKSSRKIGLITSLVAMLETTLTAQVGQEILENNAPVKEGEVIKYTATVKNKGNQTFEGIQLKAGVPEGTVYVQPVENYVDAAYTYYEEITDKQDVLVESINLAPGESYTTEYEVRVNRGVLTAGSSISNKAIVIYDNASNESSEVKNILQESNIRITIKKLIPDDVEIYAGSTIDYMLYVENLSNEDITDLKMKLISDVLTPTSVTNSDTYIYGDSIPEEISIEEVPANSVINFLITSKIDENATRIDTSAIVTNSNNEKYRSNALTEILPYADASITITATPKEGETIKYDNQIKYNITVKNTGNVTGNLNIEDTVSDYLKVEAVYINGNLKYQSTDETAESYLEHISNYIYESIYLEPNGEAQIEIITKVIYNPSEGEGVKNVTNFAEIKFASVNKDYAEITHILQPTSILEEELGNIISGAIWIDKNENGQKDSEEDALSGVNVKLYDEKTGIYLTDDNAETIQTVTDANGEYTFTKVPDGSYKIVINYDMDKYEPTTDSIAKLQNITVGGEIITVTATESIEIKDDVNGINIGLKEIATSTESSKKAISGLAWLDVNKNGQKDDDEKLLSGITVKLYSDGNIVEQTLTNSNGQYYFTKVEKGSYIIIFEYDTEKYEPTTYYAEGVDITKSSKAAINKVVINGEETTVTSTETIELQENVTDINIGLKEKSIDNPIAEEEKKVISGLAWLDENRNGQKDADETLLSGIKVRLYDSLNKNYLTDNNGNIIETTTDNKGKYALNVKKGSYIILFEYNINDYEPTTYLAEGVDATKNSKVLLRKVEINGKEVALGTTDVINVQDNVFNINIGLKEILIFDLELDKYISRIVVQNSKSTKTYDYENETFAKAEIHRKQLQGSLVVLEYTIKVKNNGEIAGNTRNIVDYLPSGLTFNSELNTDWYLSGNNLYTKSLENVEINPGEEKEIKLILTKTMTNENTGLINNRAEIYQDYNKYGETDIDSTPNNQIQTEDDFGSVDVIIGISTGGSTIVYTILLIVNMILIGIAIKLMMKNNIIKISIKRKRG